MKRRTKCKSAHPLGGFHKRRGVPNGRPRRTNYALLNLHPLWARDNLVKGAE